MVARNIDGKKWSATVQEEIRQKIAEITKSHRPPGLGVILVGDDPASRIYVTRKEEACQKVGIHSVEITLPASTTTEEVLAHVKQLADDEAIDGILVQDPLPAGVDTRQVLLAIPPEKDVDGFHPDNVGRLSLGYPRFVACTPAGVMELLHRENVTIRGKRAVIVGRSNIVGKPMGMLLLAEDATVIQCHSRTECLPVVCSSADILVVATGRPEMVRGSWIKPGAVVIDVGISRISQGEGKKDKLVGDVCYAEAAERASLITPVPGGVGPMTIAMLLKNSLHSALWRLGL
jgi:methylenetetrahydrofolate dehydrogenase (NADP+)/methenyltetrahydrofolate cyclohydrolase